MSYLSISRVGHIQPWNEAEIQTLARDTPQVERDLVEIALDVIQFSPTAIALSTGISKRWRTELQRIFTLQPRQQSQAVTTIRLIFAQVRAEQTIGQQRHGDSRLSNPFETIPDPLLVEFVGILSPVTRARFALVSRRFRDAVGAYRTIRMGAFMDNGRLMDFLPCFCHKVPKRAKPETFDAFQDELQMALPHLVRALQVSPALTESEKGELSEHCAQQIASDPQLLLNYLEASHNMSLVTLVGTYAADFLFEGPTLQSKAEFAQNWIVKKQGFIERLVSIGGRSSKMTCIPKEVYACSRLQELKLENHAIRVLHPAIGTLTSLRRLYLDKNQLECLPSSFSALTNLTVVTLCGNKFRRIPSVVVRLTNLCLLDLGPVDSPQDHTPPRPRPQAELPKKSCSVQ